LGCDGGTGNAGILLACCRRRLRRRFGRRAAGTLRAASLHVGETPAFPVGQASPLGLEGRLPPHPLKCCRTPLIRSMPMLPVMSSNLFSLVNYSA
ncbi:MAG: hypothetical protein LBT53_07030, partial [Puniceicoccales bacterium]|nr:hypothetical protein [Puniceicoccales bacterium]